MRNARLSNVVCKVSVRGPELKQQQHEAGITSAPRAQPVERFLVITFVKLIFPNCGSTNLSPFTNEQIPKLQAKTLKVRACHSHEGKLFEIDPIPMNGTVADIWFENSAILG